MNQLRACILLFLLLVPAFCFSQMGYLFVKKGFKKKRVYVEGEVIHLKLNDGSFARGYITLLRNDTIFIDGRPVPRPLVAAVILERKPKRPLPDARTMLLIGGGAALATAGLTISKQAEFDEALTAGLVIGYGPLLLKHFGLRLIRIIPRKKFRIGKKFRLQVLDFYMPGGPLRSF